MILCENLCKQYGRRKAVDSISLEVNAGEGIVLFGPNGAGKTTLMKMIAGVTKPTSGSVFIDNQNIHSPDNRKVFSTFGYISHQALTYPELTAYENLLFFARLYGVENREKVCDDLILKVGLKERRDDLVGGFSRGMKQRLSIARALVHNPPLLLLDEPFTGLDRHAAIMLSHLLEEAKEGGRTFVMITHDMTEGLRLASRIAIVAGGKIIFESPSSEVDPNNFSALYTDQVGLVHY